MTVAIHQGDCRDVLRSLPDESVHCVVTSPPYWGLRDYGTQGQMGMESSLAEYVDGQVAVFREVRRVLRRDGTLWLNLGDSYASSVNGRSAHDTKLKGNDDRTFRDKPFSTVGPIFRPGNTEKNGGNRNRDGLRVGVGERLKPKDLCGIPWRVAFALQADGWWLRQDIIWSKPNPMPESIGDRCTKAHEYLFLLSKRERYFFDQAAIAEPATASTIERLSQSTLEQQEGSWRVPGKTNGPMKAAIPKAYRPAGNKSHKLVSAAKAGDPKHRTAAGLMKIADQVYMTRNRRTVWEIATQPFSEAHFATFPPALIEPCIKAGCPAGGMVLDPFGGAGTTGLVADRLQRNAILIELNPEYVELARRRLTDDAPLFADVQQSRESWSEMWLRPFDFDGLKEPPA